MSPSPFFACPGLAAARVNRRQLLKVGGLGLLGLSLPRLLQEIGRAHV